MPDAGCADVVSTLGRARWFFLVNLRGGARMWGLPQITPVQGLFWNF